MGITAVLVLIFMLVWCWDRGGRADVEIQVQGGYGVTW